MTRLVSKSELARLGGVSMPTVSRHVGKNFAEAMHGKMVDRDHPSVVKWLRGRGVEVDSDSEASHQDAQQVPDSIEEYADLTLRELVERFGTDERFENWLKSLKTIEEIRDRRIRNMNAEGKLVSREVVDQHVFGAIESTYSRLLQDTPKTISGQLQAAVQAGQTLEELEELTRDLISAQLKALKGKARKGLAQA